MLDALLDVPEEHKRSYGIGINQAFKNEVWDFLIKMNRDTWSDETRLKAFVDLYDIINKAMDGKFYDEGDAFRIAMHNAGKVAPHLGDWNKLDMLSCNSFWRAIGSWAMSVYESGKVGKDNA